MEKTDKILKTKDSFPTPSKALPEREPLLGVVVGRKGVGKTFTTMQLIRRYVAGAGGIKARKFLIFDVNDEFTDIKALSLKDVARFAAQSTPEIRRIRIFKENSMEQMSLDEMADALSWILKNYHRGGLLVEDLSKYTSDSYKMDIIGAICTQRHRDVDMILHFQTIGKLGHPKIWANLNYVRMHKTTDLVERHKNKFGTCEHLKIAEALVDIEYRRGNQRFACYIDMDREKINGPFNRQTFEAAVDKYISENQKLTIKTYMDQRTETGGKKYDYPAALAQCRQQLFNDYWGN